MENINPKLLKVVALAKQGVGGERTNAIKAVRRICATEGLNFDDVMNASDEREYTLDIAWRNKAEEDILAQVCFKFAVPDGGDLSFNKYRKCFFYTTTPGRHIETTHAAAVYLAAFRKERKRILNDLTAAFIYKHNIVRPRAKDAPPQEMSKEDREAAARQINLMSNLEDVSIRKALKNG